MNTILLPFVPFPAVVLRYARSKLRDDSSAFSLLSCTALLNVTLHALHATVFRSYLWPGYASQVAAMYWYNDCEQHCSHNGRLVSLFARASSAGGLLSGYSLQIDTGPRSIQSTPSLQTTAITADEKADKPRLFGKQFTTYWRRSFIRHRELHVSTK